MTQEDGIQRLRAGRGLLPPASPPQSGWHLERSSRCSPNSEPMDQLFAPFAVCWTLHAWLTHGDGRAVGDRAVQGAEPGQGSLLNCPLGKLTHWPATPSWRVLMLDSHFLSSSILERIWSGVGAG